MQGYLSLALLPLALELPALAADEAKVDNLVMDQAQKASAAGGAKAFGISPVELLILLTPIIFYGAFVLYRQKANPGAKFSDFLFIVAAFAVISNIISILFFKVRWF